MLFESFFLDLLIILSHLMVGLYHLVHFMETEAGSFIIKILHCLSVTVSPLIYLYFRFIKYFYTVDNAAVSNMQFMSNYKVIWTKSNTLISILQQHCSRDDY